LTTWSVPILSSVVKTGDGRNRSLRGGFPASTVHGGVVMVHKGEL
jgi:hypothetical protein